MALNITTAVIGSGCNTAVASPNLAQWDQGQILKIEGPTLPNSYQVEFSTENRATALPAIGSADGVAIPNELLQQSGPIKAYLVLHEGEDDRETEYWITIYIRPRTPPEPITPDPDEQSAIDQAIEALADATSAVNDQKVGLIRNAGNILAEIGTFNEHPSPALTVEWSDGNTKAHITGTPTYQNMIGIYSFADSGGITPPLEFGTEYKLVFGTDSTNIRLWISNGSSEEYYTGDTMFTIQEGTTEFEIAIVVEAGTVDSSVVIGIPWPESHMDLHDEISRLVPISENHIRSLFN